MRRGPSPSGPTHSADIGSAEPRLGQPARTGSAPRTAATIGVQPVWAVGVTRTTALSPEAAEALQSIDRHGYVVLGTLDPAFTARLRARTNKVNAVQGVLAATANPQNLSEVEVSQATAALVAQADAPGAFDDLFVDLGAVALLVGAVGVANVNGHP